MADWYLERFNKYRFHLQNGTVTDWFDPEDLEEMEKKYLGRIVARGKENIKYPE